jgi:hypothetical protein
MAMLLQVSWLFFKARANKEVEAEDENDDENDLGRKQAGKATRVLLHADPIDRSL